ncbi:MAG: DivIVA domain-containing protein [Bdellovibrionales bacterium]
MHLLPHEISQKLFTKRMLGYDLQEVTDFLYHVAAQLQEVTEERDALRAQVKEKEKQLFENKEREKLLKDTITTAGQMAERIRMDAERESKMIIQEAKTKAEFITRDARDSIGRQFEEITNLKKQRIQFETQLKALIQSHLELIQQNHRMVPQGMTSMDREEAEI